MPHLLQYFMVALTSSMIELVNATIKYTIAPQEVGPEFALNKEVGLMSDLWLLYLGKFEI
jgi:hypothetical protein